MSGKSRDPVWAAHRKIHAELARAQDICRQIGDGTASPEQEKQLAAALAAAEEASRIDYRELLPQASGPKAEIDPKPHPSETTKRKPSGRTGERATTVLAHHIATLYIYDNGYDLACTKEQWAKRVIDYACEQGVEGAAELSERNWRICAVLDGHRKIFEFTEKPAKKRR